MESKQFVLLKRVAQKYLLKNFNFFIFLNFFILRRYQIHWKCFYLHKTPQSMLPFHATNIRNQLPHAIITTKERFYASTADNISVAVFG